MLRLPRKECDDSLAIWQKWQQTKSESEELTAELMRAVDHIASCPQCFSDISALGFNIFIDSNKDSLLSQFPTFLETEKQKGLLAASLKTPPVTNYLAKNRYALIDSKRFHLPCKSGKTCLCPQMSYIP